MTEERILLGDTEHKKYTVHSEFGRATGFSTWAEKDIPEGVEFHPNFLPEGEALTFDDPTSIHLGYLDCVSSRHGRKDVIKVVHMDMDAKGTLQGPLIWEHAGPTGQKTAVPPAMPVHAWMYLFLIPFFAYQYNHTYIPYPTDIIGIFFCAALLYLLLTMAVVSGNFVHRYELKKSLRLDELRLVSPAQEL